ncbi:uncharacterized protein LOC102704001 [Oryza brachyantha]|uniref:uncharacterized protein LOC102704001 n=1 Tax=Oryza brachyantha TaxID=4533 RepID=UPI0007766518|nr:uncharacterized protein LOC102704001 [Oryza brachyantha]
MPKPKAKAKPKPKPKGRRPAPPPPPPPPPASPPPPTTNVIDITSSPDAASGGGKRAAAVALLDIELDGIEIWTPRQKRRLDDDCCILAADPLAHDVVPTAAADANDDIAVVAESGKVACRDYPHPRSVCAKYPFLTTSHEDHCQQCFCYVCDVPAPCSTWKGKKGHCHASDKDKEWKVKRVARQRRAEVTPLT